MNSGQYLKDVKGQIRETDVEAVRKTVEARKGKPGDGNGAGPVLIDVREKDEWTEGFIPGARWIPRGFLELRIEDQVPERSSEVVLYCAGGTRSALRGARRWSSSATRTSSRWRAASRPGSAPG